MALRFTGSYGVVKVGYQFAFSIRNWSLSHRTDELVQPYTDLAGRVVALDQFWSTERRVSIGLHMQDNTWWVWRSANVKSNRVTSDESVGIELEGQPEPTEYWHQVPG